MRHLFDFNFQRFVQLLRNEIMKNKKRLLTISGGIAAILLTLFMLASLKGDTTMFFMPWFYPLLFGGGYYFSSIAFQEIHDKDKNYEFFLLPASMIDKLASRLVIYAFLLPIFSAALISLTSIVGSILHSLLFGSSIAIFNPFEKHVGLVIGIYIITQSIFMYASICFKKHAFFKVSMISGVIQLLMIPIIFIMLKLIFHDLFDSFPHNYDFGMLTNGQTESLVSFFLNWFQFIKFIFIFVFAPFFWFLSLLKLSESEV